MAKAKQQASNLPATQSQTAPQTTAIVKPGALQQLTLQHYAIAQVDGDVDASTALAENLAGGVISPFDLDRIRVPAGGGLAWTVIDPETGEESAATEIEGVIANWKDQKSFWKQSFDDGAHGPPDCYSLDLVQGHGDPGVKCQSCPHNEFGTARGGEGKGKACRDVRLLFVIRQNDMIPVLVPCPPTSLKAIKTFFIKLAARGIPFYRAVIKLKLKGEKSSTGIKYSSVVPELVGVLKGEDAAKMKRVKESVGLMVGKAPLLIKPGDVGGDDVIEGEVVTKQANGTRATTESAAEAATEQSHPQTVPAADDDDSL